jgi:hypothetical protein
MTIRWSDTARNELAKIWFEADSLRRREITAAASAIDKHLATNAMHQGESRPDDMRIYFERPLGVLFRVEENGSVVHLVRVWQFR